MPISSMPLSFTLISRQRLLPYILASMRKTTLVIDDALVEQGRGILGTRGVKDTVDRALEEVVRSAAQLALVRRLETLDGLDLADSDLMREAWSA